MAVKKLPLVAVSWMDAAGHEGWHSPESSKKLALANCTTVGLLIQENEVMVVLAATIDWDSAHSADHTLIPKVNIKSMTRLRWVKEPPLGDSPKA